MSTGASSFTIITAIYSTTERIAVRVIERPGSANNLQPSQDALATIG
jgi:hypothetical protein